MILYFYLHTIRWRRCYQPSHEIAVCIMLYLLSWPGRQWQVSIFFGKSMSFIFSVYYDVIKHLCNRYTEILYWHLCLTYHRLNQYTEAIATHSNWQPVMWGFIDGTFRGFCKLEAQQSLHYSDHKHKHKLHF